MKIGYKLKKFAASIRKRYGNYFDIEKSKLEDLTESQAKTIQIAESCIKNNESQLYYNHRSGEIQIYLEKIFITISQTKGYYECDIVFYGDINQTSDKIIFDSGGIKYIYDKFYKEMDRRMSKNIHTRDIVVNTHLNLILSVLEEKNN
jgi:ubiquitin